MKVWMYYCDRCGEFFKPSITNKVCPTCLSVDFLMGPYLVDEFEYDFHYRKTKHKRSR